MTSQMPLDRIKAVVDGVVERQREMDAIWGLGRLRLLVSDDLRERFDRQGLKFARLCADPKSSAEDIEAAGAGLCRGLEALNDAAVAAGCQRIDSEVWEFPLETAEGERIVGAIVRDGRDVFKVYERGERGVVVFTLDEVARILSHKHLLGVVEVKKTFPGAVFKDCRPALPFADVADAVTDLLDGG